MFRVSPLLLPSILVLLTLLLFISSSPLHPLFPSLLLHHPRLPFSSFLVTASPCLFFHLALSFYRLLISVSPVSMCVILLFLLSLSHFHVSWVPSPRILLLTVLQVSSFLLLLSSSHVSFSPHFSACLPLFFSPSSSLPLPPAVLCVAGGEERKEVGRDLVVVVTVNYEALAMVVVVLVVVCR